MLKLRPLVAKVETPLAIKLRCVAGVETPLAKVETPVAKVGTPVAKVETPCC